MTRRWLLALGTALATSLAQAGVVEVVFEQPDRFADAGRGNEAETLRQTLAAHLQTLGRDGLPAGQTLQVTVTDIDLAGDVRPRGRFAQEIRVLNGRTDWPVISLRYSLREGGRELASGSERLIEMGYLDRPQALRPSPYPHETQLLSRWFLQRFGSGAAH